MDTKADPCHTRPLRVRLAAGGRVVIPAEVRDGLGLKEGDELILTQDGEGLRMTTLAQAVREVQAFFGRLKRPAEKVVDGFLAERREEVEKEERESGRRGRK